MNRTNLRSNIDCWTRLSEHQKNGVLQAIHESTTSIGLKEYMNSLLVCREWRVALLNTPRIARLKHINLISSSLFQRFVSRAFQIDRSDSPKSYEVYEQPRNAFGWLPIVFEIPLTQKDYEVKKLEMARCNAMRGLYSVNERSQLQDFKEMRNRSRNKLLDAVEKLKSTRSIKGTELNSLSIWSLMNRYTEILKRCPELETVILDANILPEIIRHPNNNHSLIAVAISVMIFIISLWIVLW